LLLLWSRLQLPIQYKNIVSTLVTSTEIKHLNIDFVVNDIAERELARIPVKKAVFDCCGDLLPRIFFNSFDLICSKMVQEHIKSGDNFYCNIFRLLKPVGVAINFNPTLYFATFLINQIIPDGFSSFREVTNDTIPKFPATYELCYSSSRTAMLIKDIGFYEVSIFHFYRHEYFKKIPVLRFFTMQYQLGRGARDIRLLSGYAYTVVKKLE
jgi:SAM-dependent methyltransferase